MSFNRSKLMKWILLIFLSSAFVVYGELPPKYAKERRERFISEAESKRRKAPIQWLIKAVESHSEEESLGRGESVSRHEVTFEFCQVIKGSSQLKPSETSQLKWENHFAGRTGGVSLSIVMPQKGAYYWVYLNRDLSRGQIVKKRHLSFLRPMSGIPAEKYFNIINKRSTRNIKKNIPLKNFFFK